MSRALYHPHAPGPLMQRLCITFPLREGFVSYARQEAPMLSTADQLDAVRRDFQTEVALLRALVQQIAEREREITALWTLMEELEAEQRRCPRAVAGEAG